MKATMEIPDELHRQVKAKSALEGRPDANYLRSGVEEVVTFEKAAARLPAVRVVTA